MKTFIVGFFRRMGNQANLTLATLVLQPGLTGSLAQMTLHTLALILGLQPRRRALAGIRRAVLLLL